VVDALGQLPARDGVLFPASEGARINIDNFRSREWTPAQLAAGVDHRRIYDMRHTFATWSLAAGMRWPIWPQDAEDQERDLLDAYDAASSGRGHDLGSTELNEGADGDPA
jgi:integrase